MLRRRLLGFAATIALLLTAAGASAAAPPGPRLAVVKLATQPDRLELMTVGADGAHPVRLAGGGFRSDPLPESFAPPSWRPDGGAIAFTGAFGEDRQGHVKLALFLAQADGGGVRRIAGTANGMWPVFSPDGRTIAFTRFRERTRFLSATIWALDLLTGRQRRLTPWRDGLEYFASSFSPDGSTLLATRSDHSRAVPPGPVTIRLDSGATARLPVDGAFPVYSPDGTRIALFREGEQEGDSDLFVLDVASGALHRLTSTPRTIELFASWDPSGQRLAFVRFRPGDSEAADLGFGDSIMQINADGTCPTKILSAPGTAFFTPAWQPGPGREAGPIAC